TWVAGLWDDGDHDDVILLVCASAAAMHSAPPTLDSRRAVVGVVTGLDPDAPPFRAAAPVATRAPPPVCLRRPDPPPALPAAFRNSARTARSSCAAVRGRRQS